VGLDRIILDLCGGTGAWSKPYKEAGYQVINVTLPEYDVLAYQPPQQVFQPGSLRPADLLEIEYMLIAIRG